MSRELSKIRKNKNSRENHKKLKIETMAQYGGKCECCGEDKIEFLTIEHINGNGKVHRKSVGSRVYLDLKKRNFPKDNYTCLCINCNLSKGLFGYCPHEKKNKYINDELDWMLQLNTTEISEDMEYIFRGGNV